jgi:hypothetical protein
MTVDIVFIVEPGPGSGRSGRQRMRDQVQQPPGARTARRPLIRPRTANSVQRFAGRPEPCSPVRISKFWPADCVRDCPRSHEAAACRRVRRRRSAVIEPAAASVIEPAAANHGGLDLLWNLWLGTVTWFFRIGLGPDRLSGRAEAGFPVTGARLPG